MPYSIAKRDNEYCVVKDDDGRVMGCHASQADADDQLTALNIAESEKAFDALAQKDANTIDYKADDVIDEAYRRFHEVVNMSASELQAWADTECSKLASLTRAPITRNLRLLQTPKSEWTRATARSANRTVSFVERMRGAEQGEPVREGCPSKRDISLRNWAYNPNKKAKMMTDNMSYSQEEVGYVQLSPVASQACANCRWFKAAAGGDYCHVVDMYPLAIRQTGWCEEWTEAKAAEPEAPEVEIEIETPMADIETAMLDDDYEEKAKGGAASLWQAFRNLFKRDAPYTGTSFKVIGDTWLGTWTNNVQDRDGEWFSAKAIDNYLARVKAGIVPYPELQIFHLGSASRIGQANYLGAVGDNVKIVFALGTFDSTPQGQRAKQYYANTKRQHGMSHGFEFDPASYRDKTYHEFNTFELSVLPLDKAANPYTAFSSKEQKMSDDAMKYLQEALGADMAKEIHAKLSQTAKALEESNAQFKDFVDVQAAAASAVDNAVSQAEANLKSLAGDIVDDMAVLAENQVAAGKAYKAMQDELKALKTELDSVKAQLGEALKALKDTPRIASQSANTLVEDAQIPASVKQMEKRFDPFWGVELKG